MHTSTGKLTYDVQLLSQVFPQIFFFNVIQSILLFYIKKSFKTTYIYTIYIYMCVFLGIENIEMNIYEY